jgi:hypothetical protein
MIRGPEKLEGRAAIPLYFAFRVGPQADPEQAHAMEEKPPARGGKRKAR